MSGDPRGAVAGCMFHLPLWQQSHLAVIPAANQGAHSWRRRAAEAARRGQAFGSGSCLVHNPLNCARALRECHLLFSSDTAHSVLNLAVKDIFTTTKYWYNAMAQFTVLVI